MQNGKLMNKGLLAQESRVAGEYRALSGKTGAICDEIERRLLTGFYSFGQEIVVNDLVNEFGASRAPVMAALNHLRAEGYLVITPQVGCRVISPALSEIDDFLFVFSRVEGAIAEMAAKRRYPEEVDRLNQIRAEIKRIAPKKGQPVSRSYIDLVGGFHRQIHMMCHASYAGERATRNWRMLDFFLYNGGFGNLKGDASLAVADKQRGDIVEAIAERDAVAAGRLMEVHMRDKIKVLAASKAEPDGSQEKPAAANGRSSSRASAEVTSRRR
jgi:DNA-binding GntR family transcriptional regulator